MIPTISFETLFELLVLSFLGGIVVGFVVTILVFGRKEKGQL